MMNRTFFHIDEYGEAGVAYLPSILCLNNSTVLWSPAPLLLKHSKGVVGTKELLELIEKRHVSIIGRPQWFDRSWRNRSGAWEFAKWEDEFDRKLADFANEDSNESFSNKRVIIAPEEKGFELASSRLAEQPDLKLELTKKFEEGFLPIGILEKARRAKSNKQNVEVQILRDVFNHQRAIVDAHANGATVPDSFMGILVSMIEGLEPLSNSGNTPTDPDPELLRDALDLLRGIKAPTSYKALISYLSSPNRHDLLSLLMSSRAAGKLPDHVISQIEKATQIKSTLDNLFSSKDPVGYADSLSTIASLLMSTLTSTVAVGLVTLPYKVGKGYLQEKSLVPIEVDNNFNVKPLFQLAFNTKNRVYKSQIDKLIADLRKL
jgi:hypothetical protein